MPLLRISHEEQNEATQFVYKFFTLLRKRDIERKEFDLDCIVYSNQELYQDLINSLNT